MILFKKHPPYETPKTNYYHIVKKKEFRNGYTRYAMISYVINTYCEEGFILEKKDDLISVNKEERKKYRKQICQTCIDKILSQRTG